jgi:glucarate dehydratase
VEIDRNVLKGGCMLMRGTPEIVDMKVIPVAGYDSMLLTLSGAHGPIFTRNIVILKDNSGNIGLGEVHGGNDITKTLESYIPLVIGRQIGDYRNILNLIRNGGYQAAGNDGRGLQGLNLKNMKFVVKAETAVESALLDLLGKYMNLPVASLLGDGIQRDKVLVLGYLFYIGDKDKTDLPYIDESDNNDIWFRTRRRSALTTEAVVEEAQVLKEKYGFGNFKLKGGVFKGEAEMETMMALKKSFPECVFNIDPNGAWSLNQAIKLCKDMRNTLSYVEDPCGAERGYSGREIINEFKKATGFKVATNMIATNWPQYYHSIILGAVDIPLADPHFWTMNGSVRVAQLCNDWGMTWGSHSNNHFDISLAMYIHVAAAAPGHITAMDTHWIWQDGQHIVKNPLSIKNGYIEVPKRPGLGIDIDMDKVSEANKLYERLDSGDRNDALAMQYLIPGWKFDSKKPCMVRSE